MRLLLGTLVSHEDYAKAQLAVMHVTQEQIATWQEYHSLFYHVRQDNRARQSLYALEIWYDVEKIDLLDDIPDLGNVPNGLGGKNYNEWLEDRRVPFLLTDDSIELPESYEPSRCSIKITSDGLFWYLEPEEDSNCHVTTVEIYQLALSKLADLFEPQETSSAST